MTTKQTLTDQLVLLAILLLAAGLRLFDLTKLGLEHDEVANWLIDRSILDGNHGVYFQAAYGHEAGFHYVQTLFVALLGDNALALRLPAAFLGILTVAVVFALGRRLYNRPIATVAALVIATTFFPVFYSRLALRAMMLPFLAGICAILFWQAVYGSETRSVRRFCFAGLFAGTTFYTYLASRSLPIFFVLFVLYLFFADRPRLKMRGGGMALFSGIYAVVALPLLWYLRNNPAAEFRVDEVSAPLTALRGGDVLPVLENGWKIVLGFGRIGDPLWRQNVAPEPIFGVLLAILFYAGVLFMLWRRQSVDWFVLLWILAAIAPSVATIDAPSTIRMINLLPVLCLPIGVVMHKVAMLSTKKGQLSTIFLKYSWITGLTIIAFTGISRTVELQLVRWPENDEIQFVWQRAFTDAARFLDSAPNSNPVSMMGWTPSTMDSPTMQLALIRDDLELRHFGHELPWPVDVAIVPGWGESRVIRPNKRELNQHLDTTLLSWGEQTRFDHFTVYELQAPSTPEPSFNAGAFFGDELEFLGLDGDCLSDSCELVSFWRVLTPPTEPRSLFVHLIDEDGTILSQSDGLAAPTQFWQRGDLILKFHQLTETDSNDNIVLRVGIYHPQTGARVGVEHCELVLDCDSAEFILINFP